MSGQEITLSPAGLNWSEDGTPESSRFGDVYFSRADGLEETRYVFLRHNDLPERWRNLGDRDSFTIGETGFGTGLNFLAAWSLWRQSGARGRLHFVSVEKYPLSHADLARVLAHWRELEPLARELMAQYPPPVTGFHRLGFDHGRVTLTLLLGDAAECYGQLHGKVDAWFLDGFAPAKNPGMWTPELFSALARLSRPGTTFATFTAASLVRNGLKETGFCVERVKGYGRKRHMLCGRFDGPAAESGDWFSRPATVAPDQAVVIGAGIAGAATARALAGRGVAVTVLERHSAPAQEGSGNPQGVLYLKLPVAPTPQSRIQLAGYLCSQRQLDRTGDPDLWQRCGVLQLASSADEARRQQRIADCGYPPELLRAVSAAEASALARSELSAGGLFFPGGGWLAPARWCRALLDHPLIEVRYNSAVTALNRSGDAWQITLADGTGLQSSSVVLCCTAGTARLLSGAGLPLRTIRGQISCHPWQGDEPATVLCGEGYVTPPHRGQLCFGASFNLRHRGTELRAEEHLENLAHLKALVPSLAERVDPDRLDGRAALRCSAPDYLPLAGPVPDHPAFAEHCAVLRHNARAELPAFAPMLPGLAVNLAHGSKGMITAPLAAELVASLMTGDPLPLERNLIPYLHPARFLIKELKRGSI